jgi:peptidoglycan/xylan/chitin deacetylase (PgdA/CDA1 family)
MTVPFRFSITRFRDEKIIPRNVFRKNIKKIAFPARCIFKSDETCSSSFLVSSVVATLSYHKIGKPPLDGWLTWNYVGTDEFFSQLEWFQKRGWRFLSAEAFLDGLNGNSVLPEKSVLITFDDAYESLLKNALPILKSFSAPAVVFAPTQFIGSLNLFDHGVEPQERIADWNTLAALEEAGISVESHGCSHRAFSSLSLVEIQQELEFSKEALRKNLGKDSRMFAFPYGDSGVEDASTNFMIKRAGYDVAFLYGGGTFELGHTPSPLFLPRLAMGPGVSLNDLIHESPRV